MELVESIESINKQLLDTYGSELFAGDQPKFRVVFSTDQLEKRWMTHTNEGFQFLHPEVREVPKYRHYITDKYILERIVPIDLENSDLTEKVGYEPAWVFQDSKGNYLPPRFDVCSIVVDSLFAAMGQKGGFRKYKDPDIEPERRMQILEEMERTLFGNETSTTDALAHDYGVTNPAGPEHFEQSQQNNSALKAEKE